MKKQLSLYLLVALYLLAGINHFINPDFYYQIIPPYLGNPRLINMIAGISEILLALLLVPVLTRKWAGYGIILMLLAFVPAHIYMLQKEYPVDGPNPPAWILWARLIIIQPLLIWWAWSVGNKK